MGHGSKLALVISLFLLQPPFIDLFVNFPASMCCKDLVPQGLERACLLSVELFCSHFQSVSGQLKRPIDGFHESAIIQTDGSIDWRF
jgi:hypothetical protein